MLQDTDSDTQITKPLPSVAESNSEQRFWMGLLCSGLICYGAMMVSIAVYALLIEDQRNQGWIALAMLLALGLVLCCFGLRRRIVAARYRCWWFMVGNATASICIFSVCILDGDIDSPLACLFTLPILHAAIGYPLRAVIPCGIAALAGYMGVIALTAITPAHYWVIALQLLALSISFLVAIAGALNRDRKNQELHDLHRRLQSLATTDALTGCLNHRTFSAAISQEVSRAARSGHTLALLIIDVDHFKSINDLHGHLMGDEVLRTAGATLRQTARRADTAGRPGGDELALLAPEADDQAALALAQRIRTAIKAHDLPVNLTVSIGVCALTPGDGQTTTLFQRADQALYAAKRRGRDQVVSYRDIEPLKPELGFARVS